MDTFLAGEIESHADFYSAEEKHVAILASSKMALLKQKQGDLEEANQEIVRALDAGSQPAP